MVFSGGPAAGKTAIIDVLQRHLADEVAVVAEAATVLFRGGVQRQKSPAGQRIVQRAIFELQRHTEQLAALNSPGRPLICDRGSLDGAAYWPGGVHAFIDANGTTRAREYARYDAVIFLESTAHDRKSYPTGNPLRIESPEEACRLDARLRRIWSGHPNFHLIGHATNFYEKVAVCLITLHKVLGVGAHPPR